MCLSRTTGTLNDLWKFSPTAGTWTWLTGSDQQNSSAVYGELGVVNATNTPGPRDGPAAWFAPATRELWIFGGNEWNGIRNGFLNDIWRYQIQDGTWTWMHGSKLINEPGSFGTKGVYSPLNSIPGLFRASSWYNSTNRHVWIFGGCAGPSATCTLLLGSYDR